MNEFQKLEFMLELICGFPCEFYFSGSEVQIMPKTTRDEVVHGKFWSWHIINNQQWFKSSLDAAHAFAAAWSNFTEGMEERAKNEH